MKKFFASIFSSLLLFGLYCSMDMNLAAKTAVSDCHKMNYGHPLNASQKSEFENTIHKPVPVNDMCMKICSLKATVSNDVLVRKQDAVFSLAIKNYYFLTSLAMDKPLGNDFYSLWPPGDWSLSSHSSLPVFALTARLRI